MNDRPKLEVHIWDGKRHQSLMWRSPGRTTSASPAASWETKPLTGETAAQTALRQLMETLELPGIISDYHFAIQDCHQELWKHRRQEPWVLATIERLCWLDIQLVTAHPGCAWFDSGVEGEDGRYISILAFGRLIRLYEQEGYLFEALDVAKRAAHFEQHEADPDELQERVAGLEAEGVPQ